MRPPADFAILIAEGESLRSIAATLGVDRKTAFQWAKLPEIVAEVSRIQKELTDSYISRVKGLRGKALDTLDDVLEVSERCDYCGRGETWAKDRDRLKASEMVLDRGGMPATSRQEVSGSLSVEVAGRSDAEIEEEILASAIEILEARGQAELAQQIRVVYERL